MTIKVIPCPSWEHFIFVARNREPGRMVGGRLYRGHADPSWKLSSLFERWMERWRLSDPTRNIRTLFGPHGPEAFQRVYLERFKDAATGMPGLQTEGFSDGDWWALGRHHGLITPFLDWSYSPYIAAFFAFADYVALNYPGFSTGVPHGHPRLDAGKVVIWALAPFNDVFKDGEFNLITSRREDFHRQRAQLGAFTWLRHDVYLDLETYLASRHLIFYLERIEIPGYEAGKALNDLRLMNITYATLFPDLVGAAQEANIAPMISQLSGGGVVTYLTTEKPPDSSD